MTPTIKSLAAELGVSEQALRGWCKRNGIQKTTKGKITSYIITAEVAEQIKNHYTKPHNESESKTQRKSNESNTTKAYIDNLLQQIDKLNERLDKAEEERERLNAERQTTLARLFKTEDENKALKLKLNEYKAIANKKETVVEVDTVKEQAPAEEQPTQEPAENPPQQKLSFFKRLFRRK